MFSVYGRAVVANPDTTVTVKADLVDDRTSQTVRVVTYTAANVNAVRALIAADLAAMVAAETDAQLSVAVVGQLLGSI